MKRVIFREVFCLTFIFLTNIAFAQDIIILKNGDEIKSKVIEVTPDLVKYKNWANQEGPIYSSNKSEVFMIKYQNGTKDVFNITQATNSNSAQISNVNKNITVTDIDGNVYKTITIGTQTWMVENLKTTKYRNGNSIGTTTSATLDISAESAPKYQWAYAGNESNVATYGRLYTWYAATDSRNVCPTGWHLPSDAEWTTLTTYLGDESVAGGKLKEVGTSHWISPNTGATNSSDFIALPGGSRSTNGTFHNIGVSGHWWSSTEGITDTVWHRSMFSYGSNAFRNYYYKPDGFSVRCLRDN